MQTRIADLDGPIYWQKNIEVLSALFEGTSNYCKMEKVELVKWKTAYAVDCFKYAMRSARSCGFFNPGNTILVPGMYCTKRFHKDQVDCRTNIELNMFKKQTLKLSISQPTHAREANSPSTKHEKSLRVLKAWVKTNLDKNNKICYLCSIFPVSLPTQLPISFIQRNCFTRAKRKSLLFHPHL